MPITISGTTGIAGVDGSNTTPAIKGGTSTGTGVFYGTNTVSLATGGTTAVTVNSSQNVGIGTASPAYKIDVNGDSIVGRFNGSSAAFFDMAVGGTTNGRFGTNGFSTNDFFCGTTGATPLSFVTNNAERARIDSSGNLLVGTTSVNYAGNGFTISANSGTTKWLAGPASAAATNYYISAVTGSGVYLNGTAATSWTSNSDERIKENLKPIEEALSKINTLRTVTGNLINDEAKTPHAFLIAQDVLKVLPEAVDVANPDMYGVAYTETIPLAIAAIKELSAKLDAAEARIAALEGAK